MSDNPIEQIAALANGEPMPLALADDDAVTRTADDPAAESGPRAWGYDVEVINQDYALVLWGGRAVVVRERPDGPIEDRVRVLSVEAFDQWFANRFTEIVTAEGKVKAISWGRAWRTDRRRRQYAGIEFFPNYDDAPGTDGYLNLWRGFAVEPSNEGNWSIFRDHLLNQVCQGEQSIYEWVFGWFAHIVQRPRERIGTALVLRGRMGTGKTKVGEVIGSLIPAHYFQVDDPRYITGQFNAHMASCLLLQAEEAVWAGDKHAEGRLKGLVTSHSQMIESKGIDPIRISNYVRLMMTSNEDWVVPAGMDERRFCVLDVHPRCAQNHDYFREMDEQLAAGGRERLLRDLLDCDLSRVNLRDIPRTNALLEQKFRSLDPLDSWWLGRLMDGMATTRLPGWPNSVTIDGLYGDYLRSADEVGAGRKRDKATFGHRLAKLAPGIRRVRAKAEDNGKRPWIYELPTLAECRQGFEDLLGQPVAWPALPASESEAVLADDDVIPL